MLRVGAILLLAIGAADGYSTSFLLPMGHQAASTSMNRAGRSLLHGNFASSPRGMSSLRMQMQSSSTAKDIMVNPDMAWEQAGMGDFSLLSQLVMSGNVKLQRPAPLSETVVLPDVALYTTKTTINFATTTTTTTRHDSLVCFTPSVLSPFTWELCGKINEVLPRLRDANINVVVVSIASPNKARQFLDTQRELPADVLYCSQDLEAYKALGFYRNFGVGGGINQAATLPLKRLRERGFRNLDFIRRKAQNLIFMNPIGLISGRPVSLEDARATTYLGGAFAVVKGKVVYAHRDQAIADHFDMEEMLRSLGVPPQQGETYTLPTTATNPSARPSTETLFRPSGGVPGGPTPTYNPGQSGNFQGRSN